MVVTGSNGVIDISHKETWHGIRCLRGNSTQAHWVQWLVRVHNPLSRYSILPDSRSFGFVHGYHKIKAKSIGNRMENPFAVLYR